MHKTIKSPLRKILFLNRPKQLKNRKRVKRVSNPHAPWVPLRQLLCLGHHVACLPDPFVPDSTRQPPPPLTPTPSSPLLCPLFCTLPSPTLTHSSDKWHLLRSSPLLPQCKGQSKQKPLFRMYQASPVQIHLISSKSFFQAPGFCLSSTSPEACQHLELDRAESYTAAKSTSPC